MKTHPLAAQFRHTMILIVGVSIAATCLTYIFAFYLFTQTLGKDIYPADYYEKQIPQIKTYINEHQLNLLSPSGEAGLKNMIHGNGMLYQVVDANGSIIYGTDPEKPFQSKAELFNSLLDTTVIRQGYYLYTIPVTGKAGKISGAVLLSYKIRPTAVNSVGTLVYAVTILSLFSPFLYIIGFTLLFSKKFAKNINRPLQLLIDASNKIKEKDLDFEINYQSDNELGRLCSAFSEMKEELKNSLSVQWEMEQERAEMTEALAHDLKSPLSIILGCTDALIESGPDENGSDDSERLYRYLNVIKENAEKSSSLVRQMQYTSDLEKSGLLLNLQSIDLSAFLAQKISDYELQASHKQVKLILNIQQSIPTTIQTDAERLERIFDNIISNSLRYTPEEGAISIDVKGDSKKIYYEICDSGKGFSAKDLKKAFDKFYRGDESRQTRGGHSGLGLSIVKQLAEQLGGSAEVSNCEAGGARVRFWHTLREI